MKIFRRVVIIICSILLIPLIINSIPSGKYVDSYWKKEVIGDNAKVIEVNKRWKIDDTTIIIQRIIITDKNTYVRARYLQWSGWSFPLDSIEIYDDSGKRYIRDSSEGRGKLWGGESIAEYSKLPKGCTEITLKLQCYDRKVELKIPCKRGGNI